MSCNICKCEFAIQNDLISITSFICCSDENDRRKKEAKGNFQDAELDNADDDTDGDDVYWDEEEDCWKVINDKQGILHQSHVMVM